MVTIQETEAVDTLTVSKEDTIVDILMTENTSDIVTSSKHCEIKSLTSVKGVIWRLGKLKANAGLLYFIFMAVIISSITFTALYNITKERNLNISYALLTFILGVLVPSPELSRQSARAKAPSAAV